MLPPNVNPVTARLYSSFPSLSTYQALDSARDLTKGCKSLYLPLNWKSPHPVPPIRNHLPVDRIAHRTIQFTQGLSRMRMINSHLVSPGLAVPPLSLMDNRYCTLKKRVSDVLLEEVAHLFLMPGDYHHPPMVNPRPFMGMGKFISGRIHHIRACTTYLPAHPTLRSPDADTPCPHYGLEPETFTHASLSCPARQHARLGLLHGLTGVGHQDPLWTSLPLLKKLGLFISITSIGFPPTMFPPSTPPSSPPLPLSPPRVPPPVFHVFSLAEV